MAHASPRTWSEERLERILFVRTDRVGDLLMNVPLLRRLRQNYPKSRITALCSPESAPVLKLQPDLDAVLAWPGAAGERWRMAARLRAERFDAVVVSNPQKALHALAFASGAGLRAGYARKWGFLLNRAVPDAKRGGDRHEIDYQLALADSFCPIAWDGKLELGFRGSASEKLIFSKFGLDPASSFVAFHATTSDARKNWHAGRFTQVMKYVAEKSLHRVMLVGAGERPAGLDLPAGSLDLFGRTTLAELAVLLARAQALVSLDSGPYHLAWMQKTPVVGLFMKEAPGSDPVRWGVYPNFAKNIQIHKRRDDISAEEVIEAIGRVLRTTSAGTRS